MARAASAPKKEISMEEALWKSADKLRGSVEPAEYKHVVLSLFFLKFASDKFEAQRKAISEKYGEKFVDNVAFYTKDNVFFLPEISRWSFIMENAKQDDIALKIDTALYTIEKANPALKGALPDNYYSRLHIDTAKLASLLDEIDKINTGDKENDIIGRVYEYFLSKFALAEGKGKGEFYTPKCIVNLIAEMIEPYDGILYDPCCGSGGMFVQSMKFVEAHHGNKKKVSIYGQEYTNTTYKLCKMNLAIRGISANLGEMAANTFTNDQHKDLKADYIMANPPFNQKEWRGDNELIDDPRWDGYEVPPTSNANYGWILNIVSKLSQNGVAGFLLANGALSDDGTELKKIYDLSPEDDPAGIPRSNFQQDGFQYNLTDLLKQELPENESRQHTEHVSIESAKKDMESVLALLPQEREFITDDGLMGTLTLRLDTVQVEPSGYGSSTKQLSVKRSYPNLAEQDTQYIPKSIEDNGKTLTLSDIQWQTDNTANMDGYAVADRYTAVATYTGNATSSYVKGYTVTADYTGTVSRIALNRVRYVAIFEGTPIQPAEPANVPSAASAFRWSYVLIPLGIVAAAGAGVGGALLVKHRKENADEEETAE